MVPVHAEGVMSVLPDVLAPGLRIVFCGTAVGVTSAQLGAYYARPGNKRRLAFSLRLRLTSLTRRE